MTVEAINTGGQRDFSLRSRLLAWVWPDPLEDRSRNSWLAGLLGSLSPSTLGDGALPSGRDDGRTVGGHSAARRLGRWSWLWAWMWPGRVGPDGRFYLAAPWGRTARPAFCPGEPWTRRMSRHGGLVFMMFAAGAIAAPTFMDGNNGALDGGRVNLFRTDPVSGDPSGAGGGETGGQTGGDTGGFGGDGAGGGPGGGGDPQGGDPPNNNNNNNDPGVPGDFGGDGGVGGEAPGGGDPGAGPGNPPGPGPTISDPEGDLRPDTAILPGGGSGGGGGGGGGGSGGGSGGGGPGGGDPTGPDGGDPFPPPGPLNPPAGGPGFPDLPGAAGPNTEGGGGGGGGGGGCLGACSFLPNGPGDPKTDDPREPAAAVPEPGTWAMMIVGFGLAGYAIRRRRVAYRLG